MLTSFKAYKDILERIEVIITSDELKTSKDVFKFYYDLKDRMQLESDKAFQEAFKEALQEYGVEVLLERTVGPEKEPRFIFIFKSKNIYYHLSVNIYTLSKKISVQEYHTPAMDEEGHTGTFNTVIKDMNLKEVFSGLKEYEKVNDKMVCLSCFDKWNGKTTNFLVERSLFVEKQDDILENGVPKRIVERIKDELQERGLDRFDANVSFPFKDKIYKIDGHRLSEDDD